MTDINITYDERLRARLLANITIDLATGCWNWTAFKQPDGYGRIRVHGQNTMAHRAAYSVFIGPIQEGKVICHSCDNRGCINPEHLFSGTQADNMRDMLAKKRHVSGRKLTSGKVIKIRRHYAEGMTVTAISRLYPEVLYTTVLDVCKGTTWKRIKSNVLPFPTQGDTSLPIAA